MNPWLAAERMMGTWRGGGSWRLPPADLRKPKRPHDLAWEQAPEQAREQAHEQAQEQAQAQAQAQEPAHEERQGQARTLDQALSSAGHRGSMKWQRAPVCRSPRWIGR
eukprot:TRINITY_DN26259_c0_g1_i1.p4 TRINITY_DN26259_c0_g1~~TRINITY_DN26259_c0_g1_i1.p4  ORF type:complete len:108 (+),score=14.56 TRINITY_DN26259_c0_g1_i1:296-619(+)